MDPHTLIAAASAGSSAGNFLYRMMSKIIKNIPGEVVTKISTILFRMNVKSFLFFGSNKSYKKIYKAIPNGEFIIVPGHYRTMEELHKLLDKDFDGIIISHNCEKNSPSHFAIREMLAILKTKNHKVIMLSIKKGERCDIQSCFYLNDFPKIYGINFSNIEVTLWGKIN